MLELPALKERTSDACHDMFSLELAPWALSNYFENTEFSLRGKTTRTDSLAAWTAQIERERERERERVSTEIHTQNISEPNIQMQS